jgi:hypothetical protein
MSRSLPTTLAAWAHRAGQCLFAGQTITIIQFNSILIYLCANLTAQRPITKSAQLKKKKKYTYKENTKNKAINIIIIIIIIIK